MKLYFSPGACSLSPHIVLREAGFDAEFEQVDLKTKKTKSGADFTAVNPKGQVPTLVLDNGEILTEGPAIVQYLADQKPHTNLAPANGTFERYRLQEWLNFISTELHKSFSPLFNPAASADAKQVSKDALSNRFGYLDKHFAKGGPYLTGQNFTVADAYLFVVAGWSNYVPIDLGQWPKLKAFVEKVGSRPKVLEAMKAEGLVK